MANPGTFGDLGKESKETLLRGRDFSVKPTVELNTTSSNGVKANVKINKEDSGSLLGSVELKFPKSNGVESSVTLDSSNKAKGSVSFFDHLVSGLKTTLGAEVDIAKKETLAKAGYEYKRPSLTSAATFNFPLKPEIKDPETDRPWLNASLVLGHDAYGVAGGVEVDYVVATNTLKSQNVTLLYRNGSFVATAFSRAKAGKKPSHVCGGTFYSKFNNPALSNTEAAAEIACDTRAEKDAVTVTVGTAFDVNKDSRVNLTLDTKGKLLGQLTHKLNSNTKLKLGSEAYPLADTAPKFFTGLAVTD